MGRNIEPEVKMNWYDCQDEPTTASGTRMGSKVGKKAKSLEDRRKPGTTCGRYV